MWLCIWSLISESRELRELKAQSWVKMLHPRSLVIIFHGYRMNHPVTKKTASPLKYVE